MNREDSPDGKRFRQFGVLLRGFFFCAEFSSTKIPKMADFDKLGPFDLRASREYHMAQLYRALEAFGYFQSVQIE